MYVGSGGAPEGVLACAALKCVGGQFQGRLVFRNADERGLAPNGSASPSSTRSTTCNEMVPAPTRSSRRPGSPTARSSSGARRDGEWMETETILMRSKTGSIRRLFYRQRNQ